MSSIRLVRDSPEPVNELKELRAAYRELTTLLNNLEVAEGALKILNLNITAQHIKSAKWNAEQAMKAIERVGQNEAGRKANQQRKESISGDEAQAREQVKSCRWHGHIYRGSVRIPSVS